MENIKKLNLTKTILRILTVVLLLSVFFCLFQKYKRVENSVVFAVGDRSDDIILDSSGSEDNFFERMSYLKSVNWSYPLEIIFLAVWILSIIISVLAIFDKLKIFRKIYFLAPNIAALVLFLCVIIGGNSHSNSWCCIASSYGYLYGIEVRYEELFRYVLIGPGTTLIIIMLSLAIILKLIDSLNLIDFVVVDKNSFKEVETTAKTSAEQNNIDSEENANLSTGHVTTCSIEEIKKFKELLDLGIITQEEFNTKKKELLGL